MKVDVQLSELVYEFILMRLRFRHYTFGDTLPTIDAICRNFSVSSQTVKIALRRLRSEGYIDMRNGRATRVIFRQSIQEFHNSVIRFYSKRLRALPDLCRSTDIFFLPLFKEGLIRSTEEDYACLSLYMEDASTDSVMNFFCYILQKLENPLALNLHWEISLFMGLIYFGEEIEAKFHNRSVIRGMMERIIMLGRTKAWDELEESLRHFQRQIAFNSFTEIARRIPAAPENEQIGFVWRIHYGQPKLCYNLAVRIMYEIYLGEYQDAVFLPSYEKMAQKYGVSISTARRTVSLLKQAGVAEPVNGVGTRILSYAGEIKGPDFSSIAIRRYLSFFFQAFELVIFSCEEAARTALEALTEIEKARLLGMLEHGPRDGIWDFSLWYFLICIAAHSPLMGARAIYSGICGLFLWGYPLNGIVGETEDFDKDHRRFAGEAAELLRRDELGACGVLIREFVTEQFRLAEMCLLGLGIREDELRIAPAYRLGGNEDG